MSNRKNVQMGWISVNDRLPENSEDVLVWIYNGWQPSFGAWHTVAHVINGYWRVGHATVTHWMPLPQPPQEDKK